MTCLATSHPSERGGVAEHKAVSLPPSRGSASLQLNNTNVGQAVLWSTSMALDVCCQIPGFELRRGYAHGACAPSSAGSSTIVAKAPEPLTQIDPAHAVVCTYVYV